MSDPGSGAEVLLVGIAPVTSRAIAAALERRGHRARVLADAGEARELRPPAVLVVDPGEGGEGLELLAAWRRRGTEPHAVLVCGRPGAELYRRLAELGGCALLPRPFRMEELLQAVEAAPAARSSLARWIHPSAPAPIEAAARDLLAFALAHGAGPAARARLAGAAGELIENAARHAYPMERGEIEVELQIECGACTLRVRDRGLGFRPPADPPPGTGLARATALADGLSIESQPARGTCATARFELARVELAAAPLVDLSDRDFLPPSLARELLRALQDDPAGTQVHLSPALAVVVGRLLSDPRRAHGSARCASDAC